MNAPAQTIDRVDVEFTTAPAEHRQSETHARMAHSTIEAVLAAVQSVADDSLHWVVREDAGIAHQPRALLALLTYCYAQGICSSQEIEAFMSRDAYFCRLCANEFPGAWVLRRFRRFNRDAITRCLAQVLDRRQQRVPVVSRPTFPGPDRSPIDEVTLGEAQRRVELAILLDLDD